MRIEHKIRGGSETYGNRNKPQTDRLMEDALERAKLLQIEKDNVCCVFLTPEGHAATSSKFITLSFSDFADTLARSLQSRLDGCAVSIKGFLNCYRRL